MLPQGSQDQVIRTLREKGLYTIAEAIEVEFAEYEAEVEKYSILTCDLHNRIDALEGLLGARKIEVKS